MRLIIDSMIVLMVLALIGGGVWWYYGQQQEQDRLRQTSRALEMMQDEIAVRAALMIPAPDAEEGEEQKPPYPSAVERAWFEDAAPINALADAGHPWMDAAGPDDLSHHPPDPVLDRPDQAMFWYNPNRGVVRARVPRQPTDPLTLDLYNLINGTTMAKLPYVEIEDKEPAEPQEHESLRQAEAGTQPQQPVEQALTQVEPPILEPQPTPRLRPSLRSGDDQ